IAGVVAMIVISNFQYAFTLFTPGLKASFPNVAYKDIALIFTLFILFETWPVPLAGHFIDKFGIRKLMLLGATCILLGWVLGGTVATSVFHLYIFYGVITGTGAGIIYIATVANAVKWFPDRRGLAAGLTAAGFGGGSALTIIPIASMIASSGYQSTFLWFGLGQGIIVCIVGLLLKAPQAGEVAIPAAPAVQQTRRDYGPAEVLKTPPFWVMYAMFVMVGAGGLMAIAQLAPIALDYKIATVPVSLVGLTLPALTFALTID